MNIFQKPIIAKIPFAVIKYNQWLISAKNEINCNYEIIKIKNVKQQAMIMNGVVISESKNVLDSKVLSDRELEYFKSIMEKFEKVISSKDGTVWEFNNFKKYALELNVEL